MACLAEAAQGAQVDIQIGRGEAKLFGHLADFGLKLHQRFTHLLDLFLAERAPFHTADGLAFEQLSQEIDQGKNELSKTLLDIVGRQFDAGRDGCSLLLKGRRIDGSFFGGWLLGGWSVMRQLPRIHSEARGQ